MSDALLVPADWLVVGLFGVGLFDAGGDCVGGLGGNTLGSDGVLYRLYPKAAITATTKAITICVQGVDERVAVLRVLVTFKKISFYELESGYKSTLFTLNEIVFC